MNALTIDGSLEQTGSCGSVTADTYAAGTDIAAVEARVLPKGWGATSGAWDHWDFVLGLGQDLLPVVADPNAKISPTSKLRGLGKTPSRYTSNRQVVGIAEWTSHHSTDADLATWAKEPDYGICLQTRRVRAIDVDVGEASQASAIRDLIRERVGDLPMRTRSNSSKFLLLFTMPGDFSKRVLRTKHGMVEALMTGQQAVVDSTHPSGARYEWLGGLPTEIPELTIEQFDTLWAVLESKFATEPSVTSNASVKAAKLVNAAANDPTAVALAASGAVLSSEKDGRMHITCPWEDEHTPDTGGESSTTYWPANTGGYAQGHFKCLHASHTNKTDYDFLNAIGIAPDPADDFEAIVFNEASPEGAKLERKPRFRPIPDSEFKAGASPTWLVKRVLPKAELGVVYGASGSGKSFLVLDMVGAIARGVNWAGRITKKCRVVYIIAEGAGGFRDRIAAYCGEHGLDRMDIHVIPAAPNLLEAKDVTVLINEIRALGGVGLVVVDTLAQVSPGANENSGEHMGKVLGHCRTIHENTGAMVLLIHHSGKDAAKGARGWSGIKAGLNVEIEVSRFDDNRTAKITKMRDGAGEGEQYGFKLKTIPVGIDEDDDVITSCVVEHGAVVLRKVRTKKMGPNEERVWQAWLELWRLDDEPPSMEAVITAAVEATPYETTPTTGQHKRPKDNRRGNITRALHGLCEEGGKLKIASGKVVAADESFTGLHEAS